MLYAKRLALSLLVISLLLSGCTTTQQIKAKRMRFQETIPVCLNEQDCKEKWAAAQVWVARNCGMKIQIATDTIIETYNSTDQSTRLAARVLKEPIGNGKYRIVINTWCDNLLGCFPNTWDAAIDFNEYVGRTAENSKEGPKRYEVPEGEKELKSPEFQEERNLREINYGDGSKYIGNTLNGKRHGQGTYVWPDGRKYVGGFENNRATGGWFYKTNGQKIWVYQDSEGKWIIKEQ